MTRFALPPRQLRCYRATYGSLRIYGLAPPIQIYPGGATCIRRLNKMINPAHRMGRRLTTPFVTVIGDIEIATRVAAIEARPIRARNFYIAER